MWSTESAPSARRSGTCSIAYKAFYRVFDYFSSVPIPHDAGDFSLIDRRVVQWLLACGERDLFLRGLRAYVGFRQTGVPYKRPERMFGRSTNSMLKNFGWAKKGILSFSRTPLDLLTFSGVTLVLVSAVPRGAAVPRTAASIPSSHRAASPRWCCSSCSSAPSPSSPSASSASTSRKIFEEVKGRPTFIRRHLIRAGEVRKAGGGG